MRGISVKQITVRIPDLGDVHSCLGAHHLYHGAETEGRPPPLQHHTRRKREEEINILCVMYGSFESLGEEFERALLS